MVRSRVLTRADADRVWVGDLGDFDGSSKADLAIGAPFRDWPDQPDAGAVYVRYDPL